MEKEEKKADLEQLLNSLIEKGWKPFGTDNRVFKVLRTKNNWWYFDGGFGNEICFSLREIVSKESGLWQFVCENGMVDRHKYDSKTYEVRIENWIKRREIGPEGEVSINNSWRGRGSAEYRLIESSLKDESELEDFLLNSIKLD